MKWVVALAALVTMVGCADPSTPSSDETAASNVEQRPNIVLIMADDLGYGDSSAYDGWIETPNLERLAATGVKFDDFHSSGNVCSPTRAGLMTGLYQQRLGIPGVLFANPARPEHYEGIASEHVTIAEVLAGDGYATAIFGKWHLGYQAEFNPTLHGFDEFRGFVSGNLDYHSHIDMMGRADWWRGSELAPEEGYLTDLVTEHAVDFIERRADEPFFLYLPHHAPHFPFQGRDDPADRTIDGEFDSYGSREDRRGAYREMVEAMDEGIGRIVTTLEQQGLTERTIVWFFSDNGAMRLGSNGPLRGFKATDWEGGHRVPSIVRWPGVIEPGTTAILSSTLDVMPTLLHWAGIDFRGRQDGLNLAAAIAGQSALPDRRLFWGSDGTFWQGAAMREGRYKLMIDVSGDNDGAPQLFDLEADIGEQDDIADENPERVSRMLAALDAWKEEVGAARRQAPD